MLVDVGCRSVLVGHSERRHKLGENNAFLNRKVKAGLTGGLEVIYCIGETLEERDASRMQHVLASQIKEGLAGLETKDVDHLVVAYEPVWAIGTGRNATPQQAQEAHQFVRHEFAVLFGEKAAAELPILYGGSVKPENAGELMRQSEVDGALVGGADLVAAQFLAIAKAAVYMVALPPPPPGTAAKYCFWLFYFGVRQLLSAAFVFHRGRRNNSWRKSPDCKLGLKTNQSYARSQWYKKQKRRKSAALQRKNGQKSFTAFACRGGIAGPWSPRVSLRFTRDYIPRPHPGLVEEPACFAPRFPPASSLLTSVCVSYIDCSAQ